MRDEKGALILEDLINGSEVEILEFDEATGYGKLCYLGDIYYFKPPFRRVELYNEILAEELAKDYGIPSTHIELVVCDDKYYILAQDVEENGYKFITISDIINDINGTNRENSLVDIWCHLEKRYKDKNQVEQLMNELVNIFLFDVLIANYDRHSLNYGILESKDEVHFAKLFDNDNLLSKYSIEEGEYAIGIESEDNMFSSENYFDYFIRYSDDKYINEFKTKLWIIEESNMLEIFKRIEERLKVNLPIDYKKDILNRMNKNLTKIKEILRFEKKMI